MKYRTKPLDSVITNLLFSTDILMFDISDAPLSGLTITPLVSAKIHALDDPVLSVLIILIIHKMVKFISMVFLCNVPLKDALLFYALIKTNSYILCLISFYNPC